MTGLMTPEQFVEYLEISQKQFLELVKSQMPKPPKIPPHSEEQP